jgi:hypothetical protein
MGAAVVLVHWSVMLGAQHEVCYQRAGEPQVCISDNSGRVQFSLAEDTLYSFSYRTNGIESPPLSFRTEKVKVPLPAPCPSPGPSLPPIEIPNCYHPNGQPYRDHWTACKDTLVQTQGLVARLRKVCGRKCSAVR